MMTIALLKGVRGLGRQIWAGLAGAVLATSLVAPVGAQGFGASISPPRFEVQVKPGQTLRQVIEIQHIGTQNGTFRIYTNDWEFQRDGSVAFSNELAEGSCRPWVAVERRDLTITPNTLPLPF